MKLLAFSIRDAVIQLDDQAGFSMYSSQIAFPGKSKSDHFFVSRNTLDVLIQKIGTGQKLGILKRNAKIVRFRVSIRFRVFPNTCVVILSNRRTQSEVVFKSRNADNVHWTPYLLLRYLWFTLKEKNCLFNTLLELHLFDAKGASSN